MNSDLRKEFTNPSAICRGAPFRAWNCKLDKDQLLHQIDCFKKMGMGGFHMHSRVGLNTEHLWEFSVARYWSRGIRRRTEGERAG